MREMNFTSGEKMTALTYGAVLAYFIVYFSCWLFVLGTGLPDAPNAGFESLVALTFIVLGSLFFGLVCVPIAITFCWSVGFPIWTLAEKFGGNSIWIAIFTSVAIYLLTIGLVVISGQVNIQDFTSQSGAISAVTFLIFCVVIGLFVYHKADKYRRIRLEDTA